MSVLRDLYRGKTNIEFIGRRNIWFALSAVVLAVSLGSMLFRSAESPCTALFRGLNCGIEFKGGIEIRAPIDQSSSLAPESDTGVIAEVRETLTPLGAEDAQIQVAGEGASRELVIQSREIADPERQSEVVSAITELTGADDVADQRIGSKWGAEITNKARNALIVFMLVILAFISWRFEWKMAIAAIIALIHDLVITAGVYSIVGFQVTPSTVIALLTILGYSLYDTVVIFDRVDEDVGLYAMTGKMTYAQAANGAINTVLARSINTSLTTLLPTGALLFVGVGLLGASTLKDLALALMIGILAGTYSSVFTAVPVLSLLKEREPRYRSVREKVLRDAAKRAERLPEDAEATEEERVAVSATPKGRTPASDRPPPRRAGSRKAKRRKRR
ncbi:MAG: protein translocase subunit SecF [Actinomycetota bacterium]